MKLRTILSGLVVASSLSACAGTGSLPQAPAAPPSAWPAALSADAPEPGTLPWHVTRTLATTPTLVPAKATAPSVASNTTDLRAQAARAIKANATALDVASAYIGVLERREQTRILRDYAARQEALVQTVDRLTKEGSVGTADLFEAAANAARAKADLIQGQQAQRDAEGRFAVLAGESLPAEIVAPDPLPVDADAGKAVARVMSHPRLRAADADVADAETRLRDAEDGLFSGPSRREAAEAAVAQARAQRDLVRRSLEADIRRAHAAFLASIDVAELAVRENRATQHALEIRTKDFLIGAVDLRVVIEGERARLAAMAKEANARWAKLAGGYAFAAALGDLAVRLSIDGHGAAGAGEV